MREEVKKGRTREYASGNEERKNREIKVDERRGRKDEGERERARAHT